MLSMFHESVSRFGLVIPFELPESSIILGNLRKAESSGRIGRIETPSDFIKFSDSPKFNKEIARYKRVSELFSKYKLSARVPQLHEVIVGSDGVTYARFEKIRTNERGQKYGRYISLVLNTIRDFAKIPPEELENPDFEKKDKQSYLEDINSFTSEISMLFEKVRSSHQKEHWFHDPILFERYQKLATQLFAEQNGFSYDLAQGFTHSDFSQHNKVARADGRVYVLDFEKTLLGSRWEDYARMFDDLNNHNYLEGTSADKYFWGMLDDHEKKHTKLFLIYKSLYLLRHHLREYVHYGESLRGTRVIRCFQTFLNAVDYFDSSDSFAVEASPSDGSSP